MNYRICTKENPQPKNSKTEWKHPNSVEIEKENDHDGMMVTYQCLNCGKKVWLQFPLSNILFIY